jgi:uncharacterized protein (DUF4213/DUF364 family)
LRDDGAVTVAAEILEQIERLAQASPLPAVKALHLPPPSSDGTREGEFCAVELDDGSLGLSFVLLGATLREMRGLDRAKWPGMPATALAREFARPTVFERTLGLAAVNAITRWLFDRARFRPPAASGSIGDLGLQATDHLGMIGLFPPLVPRVLATGARLTVLELRAELAGPRERFQVTLDPAALAGCNKILSTSTVLLNDTLDGMLARCRHAERFALIGPGASCLPDALFARGVTSMGGVWIDDAEAFTRALAQGEPSMPFATKFALRREDYPGFQTLLERASG